MDVLHEDMDVTVQCTSAGNRVQRVWDKKQFCPYCEKSFSKLPRHLQQQHHDEMQVQLAFSFPKNSDGRKKALLLLRNLGNSQHNRSVLRESKGTIVPCKRTHRGKPVTEYVICKLCLGTYVKAELWKHMARCSMKFPEKQKSGGRHLRCGSLLMTPAMKEVSSGLRENVLAKMNDDRIAAVAKNDPLVVKFGETLYEKHGHHDHLHGFISNKLREVARFLLSVREQTEGSTCLEDCIKPSMFQVVVKAVKVTAGYDEKTHKFSVPSLALKLTQTLRRCAEILETDAIVDDNSVKQKDAANFSELCKKQFSSKITTHALSTLSERKYNRPQLVPIAADVQKLLNFLDQKAKLCLEELKSDAEDKTSTWMQLCSTLAVTLVVFNRKRVGEVQRLRCCDYDKIDRNVVEQDTLEHLSILERHLASNLRRIEVRGKKGKKVALLITAEMRGYLDTLMQFRSVAGIPPENQYVFAKGSSCINACKHLRKFSSQCGAENPNYLTSTGLRKQIATMAQFLNLQNNELDSLAKFLGHDINIHREFYRLPQNTIELAKVSKLLFAVNSNNLQAYESTGSNVSADDG